MCVLIVLMIFVCQNKDQKVAFLQKIVDVIIMTSEETVKVRPSKIVAGHEAERTNEFLQALSSVVANKVG